MQTAVTPPGLVVTPPTPLMTPPFHTRCEVTLPALATTPTPDLTDAPLSTVPLPRLGMTPPAPSVTPPPAYMSPAVPTVSPPWEELRRVTSPNTRTVWLHMDGKIVLMMSLEG